MYKLKLFLSILMLLLSASSYGQSNRTDTLLFDEISCLDRMMFISPQEFDLPTASEKYQIKKLILVANYENGRFSGLEEFSIGFESAIKENIIQDFWDGSCDAILDTINLPVLTSSDKIVRVYTYFLKGPELGYMKSEKIRLGNEKLTNEVNDMLEDIKKNCRVVSLTKNLITVGYPRY